MSGATTEQPSMARSGIASPLQHPGTEVDGDEGESLGSLGPRSVSARSGGKVPFYLTVDEVARDYLRTSRKAVYEMIRRNQLPGVVRILKRRVLVRRVDLLRWLQAHAHRTEVLDDDINRSAVHR
jgi:excisionase family DNA binding protein